ncbi:LLM class flavin-dependent oxidoreductase [Streptomyces sp. NPDC021020]|uniref:LLM class flavin-dependent oxidoreductase n=1 Tax=Streptomyces sp. NPDC021020 TaxID=3365109 RepID=UPI00378E1973
MEIFAICPHHTDVFGARDDAGASSAYTARLAAHCGAAERLGATGMLVFDFWQSLDPWITAQLILSATTTLEPVVAVNPAFTHPAIAARSTAGLAHVYGRRVNLNVVAGAKERDLAALGAAPGQDGGHARNADFIRAVHAVLAARPHEGSHYRIDAPALDPTPDPATAPRVLSPGSRAPGIAQVLPLLDRALVMGKSRAALAEEHARLAAAGLTAGLAMVLGIVARPTAAAAWDAARAQYTGSRRDRLASRAFNRHVTSSQHTANIAAAADGEVQDECLWYGADRVGGDAPKLVGSYEEVGRGLASYARLGVRTLILDLPAAVAEFDHIGHALEAADDAALPA